MENLEITYKGKKIVVQREENGNIIFPRREDEKGIGIEEAITREPNGWKFSSKKENGDFLNFWLYSDRTMVYENAITDGPVVADRKFNPMLQTSSLVNDVCKEIYDVMKQVREYEVLGVPAEKVVKMRKKSLDTALKMLGYSNPSEVHTELDESAGYMALSRIGNQLREYRNIAPYAYRIVQTTGEEEFSFTVPTEINRQTIENMIRGNVNQLYSNLKFIKHRDDQNERMRDDTLLPNFCLNMKSSIPPEDWQLYSKVVRETALLYLSLNTDLLSYADRNRVANATSLEGADLKKKIAGLVGAAEFSRACEIETEFVRHQVECLKDKIDGELAESKVLRESTIGEELVELKGEADSIYSEMVDEDKKANKTKQGVTQTD